MSERKVLNKYYPPDFDPSAITRVRGVKKAGPKVSTVRLMAPFSMKCNSCGEFIYKGRKFNARKETTDEKYYSITQFRFHIRCTRCSAEILFKTDPKNMDYICEKGAKRNFEPWRQPGNGKEETEEERLDRLEAEEAERDAMGELEEKVVDAKREMQIADALDGIRSRNARNERAAKDVMTEVVGVKDVQDEEREQQEREDEEAARKAFRGEGGEKVKKLVLDYGDSDDEEEEKKIAEKEDEVEVEVAMPPPPTLQRGIKRKKDLSAALGIKKKPALV
ncbi:MAG: hypothetical protein MMC23_003834 [Stictis urceolatum]|nr:hypothetical protein [Stictis urceolata]